MSTRVLVMGQNVNLDLLRTVADARSRLHRSSRSSRPLSDDYQLIGLLGQWQFSLESGMPMDLSIRHQGDGGQNFTTSAGKTIGVSTARKALYLLREAYKPGSDIHVLAQVSSDLTTAALIGWEFDSVMRLCPVRTMGSHHIQNHVMLAQDLRPMADLFALLKEGV